MTPFARKVYKIVLSIPIGQVRSYKWIASKAGRPAAARSVGQILKQNPYPLFVPCHRVVKANGGLGGYRWGKKTKQRLLELEKEISKAILITKKGKR
ncbi:MAG: MGMT family protein [Candidatus Omnitrophica bacterium]|nr:MGMT family protein [Candidatus Omnitrophota bacterium]